MGHRAQAVHEFAHGLGQVARLRCVRKLNRENPAYIPGYQRRGWTNPAIYGTTGATTKRKSQISQCPALSVYGSDARTLYEAEPTPGIA